MLIYIYLVIFLVFLLYLEQEEKIVNVEREFQWKHNSYVTESTLGAGPKETDVIIKQKEEINNGV